MQLKHLFITCLLFCVGFVHTSAKSYEIPEIRVEVTVNSDGTVQITEHLTYVFDGSFSWGEYELPKKGYSAITDIQVWEDGQSYINENSEKPGTFSVAENDDAIRLQWHYNAEDERRTFTISYTLEGALTVGPEWSQFFWNYVSENRDKFTKQLDVSINLPQTVSTDSLHGWTRRPLGKSLKLEIADTGFNISGRNIDDDEFAKVRAVFPSSVLNSDITDPDFSISQARQEELAYQQRMAEVQERIDYWDQRGKIINIAIAIIALLIFYFLYQKYGKRYSTSHLSSTETIMAPGRERPAAIGWLLNQRNTTSVHLISTVLDLARRGYFKIHEKEPGEGFFEDENPEFAVKRTDQPLQNNLLEWERSVIQFTETRLDDSIEKLDEIFKGSNSEVSSWFSKWKTKLKEYCFNQDWIDLKSYNGAFWNLAIQLFLFSVAVGLLFYIGTDILSALSPSFLFSWFAAVIITFVSAILSLTIIRPTKKGEELKHQWTNYKSGLENAKEHSISSNKLDQHFIYGLALGLGKDELKNIFTTNTESVPAFTWIIFYANTTSPAAIASSFSTLAATGAASAPGTSPEAQVHQQVPPVEEHRPVPANSPNQ